MRESRSEINCPGLRVQSTRAIAPLRIRILAGLGAQMSEPRNSGRLGLWPTTNTLSYAASGGHQSLEARHCSRWRKDVRDLDLAVVSNFSTYQRGGLQGALERA